MRLAACFDIASPSFQSNVGQHWKNTASVPQYLHVLWQFGSFTRVACTDSHSVHYRDWVLIYLNYFISLTNEAYSIDIFVDATFCVRTMSSRMLSGCVCVFVDWLYWIAQLILIKCVASTYKHISDGTGAPTSNLASTISSRFRFARLLLGRSTSIRGTVWVLQPNPTPVRMI